MGHRCVGFLGLAGLIMLTPVAAAAQTRGDTVVYGIQSDVPTWDPTNSVLRESVILGYNVFDHLAARISTRVRWGRAWPLSWKTLGASTWEVKLRPGVKFHDGTPFTAKDVKATFERVLDEKNKLSGTGRSNHAKIKSVEVIDDLTVRFHIDGPPLFVKRLTASHPVEKAIGRRATTGCRKTRSAPALQARQVDEEAGTSRP